MDMNLSELPGGIGCVQLQGRLDAAGADRIGTRLTTAVVAVGRPAVLDLSGVEFLGSMGIGLLISLAKGLSMKGQRLALYGAPEMVQATLDHAAIAQLMPVVRTQDEAVAALSA